MDTSRMLHLEELSPDKLFALYEQCKELKNTALGLCEFVDRALVRGQILDMLGEYDLGAVKDVFEIFGGYVNRSFGIYTEKNGGRKEYFVRKYKKGVTEKEIRFEHALIEFSIDNGLSIAARLIRAKNGETYVKRTEGDGVNARDIYFAVYQYLHGEDKYAWNNNELTDGEYASIAGVLATFHNASRNFDPMGLERVEPKIMDFLPTLPKLYNEFARRECNTMFHRYYLENLDEIIEVVERSQLPAEITSGMPCNPCHNDFHPGNLKYRDNEAVGLFDFDWSKIDLRLFDVCLALTYCCSSWKEGRDGDLLLDKCAIFLKSYQDKLKELGGLEPLNEVEIKHMPTMMAAANIYLINWDVTAYYRGTDLNDYEYTAYLQHNVRLMRWIENNKEAIARMAGSI